MARKQTRTAKERRKRHQDGFMGDRQLSLEIEVVHLLTERMLQRDDILGHWSFFRTSRPIFFLRGNPELGYLSSLGSSRPTG